MAYSDVKWHAVSHTSPITFLTRKLFVVVSHTDHQLNSSTKENNTQSATRKAKEQE
jgi:hypothetical protein